MTDLSSEVLTVAEAAELLRCSVDVVYDMVRRNEIPHGRLGRSIRFHRRALEQYLGWSPGPQGLTEVGAHRDCPDGCAGRAFA